MSLLGISRTYLDEALERLDGVREVPAGRGLHDQRVDFLVAILITVDESVECNMWRYKEMIYL